MKVLFAVSNEEISEAIVKKYQKEYKQIISYKNVYYFNAIIKELQKEKSYDRIVISEDLESFSHNQYDQIDKFIFEKLDNISDEASNIKGDDTPIILICSDRRTKSEAMLVKLFGIGIYNAIIGTDRSVDEVCKLINRPRVKKEAKAYYKIDTDEVNYQAENENDVSEMEIQNILAHYKRLGKNEERYVESFNNIAAQYNDTQLRIITKFLPLNVRAVLEEKSQKYQQIMSFNNSISKDLRKGKSDRDDGPSQVLLKSKNRDKILSKPVVIPSAVNMAGVKKLSKQKPYVQQQESNEQYMPQEDIPQEDTLQEDMYMSDNNMEQHNNNYDESFMPDMYDPMQNDYDDYQEPVNQTMEEPEPYNQAMEEPEPYNQAMGEPEQYNQVMEEPEPYNQAMEEPEPYTEEFENLDEEDNQNLNVQQEEVIQPVKKGRGRPRKVVKEEPNQQVQQPKRGRGRPKKSAIPQQVENEIEEDDDFMLPGLNNSMQEEQQEDQQEYQQQEYQQQEQQYQQDQQEENFLPGFGPVNQKISGTDPVPYDEEDEEYMTLPGMDYDDEYQSPYESPYMGNTENNQQQYQQQGQQQDQQQYQQEYQSDYQTDYQNDYQTGYQPVAKPQPYQPEQSMNVNNYNDMYNTNNQQNYGNNMYNTNNQQSYGNNMQNINTNGADLSTLLTPDKKVATFVGTSKNGTSFIVNNLAELMSSIGINTAILDTTKNRNSYYIYTKNEEPLRQIAAHSIEGLAKGTAKGITVSKNLTVYTSLPNENEGLENVDKVIETLLMHHSLILIDTDFDTPVNYFKQSQETYLVQTMDILTIQPLTAFLKELKMKNILDERKLRIVLNKVVKIKGIKDEVIIGGLAFYNDPSMSFMTELFDRDRIKYISIPFEEETYIRYLEGVIDCEISLRGYSKIFLQQLRELGNIVYPIIGAEPTNPRNNYGQPSPTINRGGNFSAGMNNTLDRMKRNY